MEDLKGMISMSKLRALISLALFVSLTSGCASSGFYLNDWDEPRNFPDRSQAAGLSAVLDPNSKNYVCQSGYDDSSETVLVSHSQDDGKIQFAGINIESRFVVDGMDRIWAWGDFGDSFRYVFRLTPSNAGYYYDFSHSKGFVEKQLEGTGVEPRSTFSCEEVDFPSTGSSAIAKKSFDIANWRKLKLGMSQTSVREALGEPDRIDASKYFIYWYYANGGRVKFDTF